MSERKRLTDILAAGGGNDIGKAWESTTAADDFAPLPPGEYTFRILSGELLNSKQRSTLVPCPDLILGLFTSPF